ncbi:hypothetical protein IGI04_018740, partial [Brassica rapa subsp. trilocularis]
PKAREIFTLKVKVSLEFIKNIQLIKLGTGKYSGLITGQKYAGRVAIAQIDREARGVTTQGIRKWCQSLSKLSVYEARHVSAGMSVSCSLTSRSTRCRKSCGRGGVSWNVKEACIRACGRPCVATHATTSMHDDTHAIGWLILPGWQLLYIPSYLVHFHSMRHTKETPKRGLEREKEVRPINCQEVPKDCLEEKEVKTSPFKTLTLGFGINITVRRRRFGGEKKGLVNFRNQKVKPHLLITVTSRKDHSARGTVGASVDWKSFAKDSFSRYMNICFAFGCIHGPLCIIF